MANCCISDGLKMAALRLKACGCNSLQEILQIVQFSHALLIPKRITNNPCVSLVLEGKKSRFTDSRYPRVLD